MHTYILNNKQTSNIDQQPPLLHKCFPPFWFYNWSSLQITILKVDDGKERTRPKYLGLRHAISSIFKQEGLKGFYKGVTPNIAGAGTAWGLYFLFYNRVKSIQQKGNTQTQLSPAVHMLCASEAGLLTLILTNPIWVIKTRLCLQFDSSSKNNPDAYKGMFDAFRRILKAEGLPGLYKGFVPGIFGVSHGAIQFMIYEEFKCAYNNYLKKRIDSKLETYEYLAFSALSKFIAALTTYPYQVVRARLQDRNSQYTGSWDCVKHTYRDESFRGFYKGLVPNLMRVIPATAITFLSYESIVGYFKD
ncbi:solute carrier family 25 member 32 isoform X2 [Lepeophtheirus salmonis]|uniref:solute carrier family 25 member 32 isoform X2 n=1 Tax=Lepeophtheirus salmonis TaxID=72036 RepID=UPI001AEB472A|nr:mitochondrial folate transporter/carrier-like isoform X2 [Lepeophtheirus salmonis]